MNDSNATPPLNFDTNLLNAFEETDASSNPCIFVIFGASGDLTKRLLIPSLFNLYSDKLLDENFSILGVSRDGYDTQSFREKMSEDVHEFSRRESFDEKLWEKFCNRIHFMKGMFDDANTYSHLTKFMTAIQGRHDTQGNAIFYMATPSSVVGIISAGLKVEKLNSEKEGWRRIIVEKPFGSDLATAKVLNEEILSCWKESQVYRIDHYLGKEAVQNLLAFRFANGMFEPLWNRNHIDHIQITATEKVGVEWRGGYYDNAGVLRDMIQNHLFQIMSYLCMEPPTSFDAEAIRNEKYKLLSTIRIIDPEKVHSHAVRGQYDAGVKPDGSYAKPYREEHLVDPESNTETFAAVKLCIDNWRWDGVPIFIRSGKGLSTKSTEIVVQFRQAPSFTFRGTPAASQLEANQLIFHIHPKEGIELRFLAKRPGPSMQMRKVDMDFEYDESFVAQPGTGYETMLNDCMRGDPSLFSRTDLVETSWKIVQPIMDVWANEKAEHFPNYPFGSWGPKAAFELLASSKRRWLARSHVESLQRVPIFEDSGKTMMKAFGMMLKPVVFNVGDQIVEYGSEGQELYIIEKGSVDIVDKHGKHVETLSEGQVFGELSLLVTKKRHANVFAKEYCDLYTMNKSDFCKVLMDRPVFAERIMQVARERYNVIVDASEWAKIES
ncbi:MAG: glucose-6-phosphate dehydrogenase [Ghiorsea sp.]